MLNFQIIKRLGWAFTLLIAVSVSSGTGCSKSHKNMSFLSGNPFDKQSDEPDFSQTGSSDASSTITIWHDSYEAAKKEAMATGKPILADFTGSDWCHWCVKLKKDVFSKPEFESWARDNVVLLELDFPKKSIQSPTLKKQNAKLAKQYNISGYPTVLLLDPEGNSIGKLGYMDNPSDWVGSAKEILNNSKVASQSGSSDKMLR